MVGYFGNGVLPMRLGELMRAVAIGRRGGRIDVSTALGSIAVERLLDVVSALAVAALVVPFSGGLSGGLAAWSGAALVIGAFGGLLWGLAIGVGAPAGVARRVERRLEAARARRIVPARPPHPRRGSKLVPIGLATVVIWLLYGAAVWTAARAAGIPLSWLDTGLVLFATAVAVSVPAAPATSAPTTPRSCWWPPIYSVIRRRGAGVRDPVARVVLAADGRDRRALSAAQLDQAGRGVAPRGGDRPPTLIGSWRASAARCLEEHAAVGVVGTIDGGLVAFAGEAVHHLDSLHEAVVLVRDLVLQAPKRPRE